MGFRLYLGNSQTTTPSTPDPGVAKRNLLPKKLALILKTTKPLGPSLGFQTYTLYANGIEVSAVLASSAVSQIHALSANPILGSAVLASPALTQTHVLAANPILGSATLDSPALSQVHSLVANGIAGSCVLDQSALRQNHSLTADGVTGSVELGTSTLTEVSGVVPAVGVKSSILPRNLGLALKVALKPERGVLITSNNVALSADGLTITSVLGSPAISQVHALSAGGLIVSVQLDSPTLQSGVVSAPMLSDRVAALPLIMKPGRFIFVRRAQSFVAPNTVALSADSITAGSATLDAPALQQVHVLNANAVLGNAVLGSPVINQVHVLNAVGLSGGAPALANAVFNQQCTLIANSILAGLPELDQPSLNVLIIKEQILLYGLLHRQSLSAGKLNRTLSTTAKLTHSVSVSGELTRSTQVGGELNRELDLLGRLR